MEANTSSPNVSIKETAKLFWNVENFSSLSSRVCSPYFFSSTSSNNKFRLFLDTHPLFGINNVFLSLVYNCNEKALVLRYRVTVIDATGEKHGAQEHQWNYQESNNPYYNYNITIFMYKSQCSQYLVDDVLKIYCELEILDKAPEPLSYTFKDSIELIEDYQSLLDDGNLSDVALLVVEKGSRNSKRFKAHKAILAARSPVFRAMFKHKDSKESKESLVKITDLSSEVCEEMLRYIYTGMVFSMSAHAAELFIAADKYQLEHLKSICEQFLSTTLTNDSVVELLVFADMHHSVHLKSKCIEHITKNSVEISKTKQWTELIIKSRPDLLVELYLDMSDRTHKLLNAS